MPIGQPGMRSPRAREVVWKVLGIRKLTVWLRQSWVMKQRPSLPKSRERDAVVGPPSPWLALVYVGQRAAEPGCWLFIVHSLTLALPCSSYHEEGRGQCEEHWIGSQESGPSLGILDKSWPLWASTPHLWNEELMPGVFQSIPPPPPLWHSTQVILNFGASWNHPG